MARRFFFVAASESASSASPPATYPQPPAPRSAKTACRSKISYARNWATISGLAQALTRWP
jgi:hypothetical protein